MKLSIKTDRTFWTSLGLALFALVAILPLRSNHQLADSMGFIASVQTGHELFHPHHILFAPIVYALYHLLQALHLGGSAMLAGQLHNAAWAAAGLVALLLLIRQLRGSLIQGALVAAILLFCCGYWTYGSLVEPYVPAAACALCLLPLMLGWVDGPLPLRRKLAFLFFFTMMIAYQQPNILFIIPLAVYVASLGRRKLLRELGVLVAIGGVLLLGLYIYIYLHAFRAAGKPVSAGGFVKFCLTYAAGYNKDWGRMSYFSPSGVRNLCFSQFLGVLQVEGHANHKNIFALLAALFILGVTGWNIFQVCKRASFFRFRLFALAWLAVYFTFYLWWLPTEKEFFIITLVPLLVLAYMGFYDFDVLGVAAPRWSWRQFTWAAFVPLVVLLGSYNFKNSILPGHAQLRDAYYGEAERFHRLATKDDVILTNFITSGYLSTHFENFRHMDVETAYHNALTLGTVPKWFTMEATPQYLFAVKSLHLDAAPADERGRQGMQLFHTRLLGWTFGAAGKMAGCREFQVVKFENALYLRVTNKRLPVSGAAEYLDHLRDAIKTAEAGPASGNTGLNKGAVTN